MDWQWGGQRRLPAGAIDSVGGTFLEGVHVHPLCVARLPLEALCNWK